MEGPLGKEFHEEVLKINSFKGYLLPTFWVTSIILVGIFGYTAGNMDAPPKFLAAFLEAWEEIFPNKGQFVEVVNVDQFSPNNVLSKEPDRIISDSAPAHINQKKDTLNKNNVLGTRCFYGQGGKTQRNTILINEIAWMGGLDSEDLSASDEWIELKNISDRSIDLSGWLLVDKDDQIKILFPEGSIILPRSFYLLERTDDDSVPGEIADLIYSGNLSNENEGLRLFNKECLLEDEVIVEGSWLAGDAQNRRSMERSPDLDWHTYSGALIDSILGTPGRENSMAVVEIVNEYEDKQKTEAESISSKFSLCSQGVPSMPTYEILINEVAWAGKSENTSEEWIELYNPTNKEIDLDGWQLLDKESSIVIIFNKQDAIDNYLLLKRILSTDDPSKEYKVGGVVADRTYTGVIQNSEESLMLFDESCRLVDRVSDVGSNWNRVGGTASPDYRTAERTDIENWHTYSGSGNGGVMGTPRSQNSTPEIITIPSGGGSGGSSGSSSSPDIESSPEEETSFCSQDDLSSPTHIVYINEIAWAGSASSTNEEWFELYTSIQGGLSLSGWQLLDKNREIQIEFGTDDRIDEYILLKRILTTDDLNGSYFIGGVGVDYTYTGVLQNEDENLRLFDASCNLVDEVVDVGSSWINIGGTASPDYKTAERAGVGAWQTYLGAGENGVMGTPGSENSGNNEIEDESEEEDQDEDQDENEGDSSPELEEDSNGNGESDTNEEILNLEIEEVIYDVEGADEGQERIVIKNNGSSTVILESYSIQYLSTTGDFTNLKKKNFESGHQVESGEEFVIGLNCSGAIPCEGVDMSWSQALGNTGGMVYLVSNQDAVINEEDLDIIHSFLYGEI